MRTPYDPLAVIPSPDVLRERLTQTLTLAERLRIMLELAERLRRVPQALEPPNPDTAGGTPPKTGVAHG